MTSAPLPKYEIEAKYEVAGAAELKALKELFCSLSSDKVRERSYNTVIHYFDTDDFTLDQAGVVLRTMDAHEPEFPAEICVKTRGEIDTNGNLKREEYVIQRQADGLDIDALDENPRAAALVAPARKMALKEIFSTVSRRNDVCLRFEENGKKVAIDVALDHVMIRQAENGDVLRHAFELEIEFKQSKSDANVTEEEALAVMSRITESLKTVAPWTHLHEGRGEMGFRLIREKRQSSGPAAA